MANETAKRDFSVILENLNRKFDITDCKWTENKFFEIKFRTQIPAEPHDYNTYCDNWADEFSQVTATVWVHKVSNTGPKVKFRKQYQCWTYEDKEVQKELLFDACRCKGTLDIKILGDMASAKKTNKYLRLGLNAIIRINFHHLHPVDVKENYSFFVHQCEPQPEPPRPVAQPNEKVSQLVAKMVENAAVSSRRAGERAQEALKRQCVVPQSTILEVRQAHTQTACQTAQNITYHHENTTRISEVYEPPVTQLIVNSDDGQTTETYYIQNVVFDATTQTITEVIPVSDNGISNNMAEHQIVEVQIPQTTHISQVLEVPYQVQGNEGPSVMRHF